MEFRLAAAAYMPSPRYSVVIKRRGLIGGDGEAHKVVCFAKERRGLIGGDGEARKVVCFAKERRGFGPEPTDKDKSTKTKTPKENMPVVPKLRVVYGGRKTGNQLAPEFASSIDRNPKNAALDSDFLKKVEAVRRSALEQKKTEENKTYQAIDYDDVPIEAEQSTIGLGTKVGVGIAVVVFGLVFALGDFLPSGSVGPSDNAPTSEMKLTEQEKATLQSTLQQYEETLRKSPNDPTALEGAAVTLADLGEYEQASSLLEKLIKERPSYMDAYHLLGEVKYELKDYDASVSAYKRSLSASDNLDFDVLRGLTNSLLASKKPNEAVQVLLSFRERLNDRNINGLDDSIDTSSNPDQKIQKIDPIQVELLLGKAYSDWGHVSDAVNVYDQLISKHPADFRGYLAKGIILKENGKVGDAERMFIQARFFAPEPGKALVDRYARR